MRRRSLHIPRCATVGANQQANEQHKRRSVRNSWTLPSPKQNRRNDNENGDVNKRRNKLDIGAYATLPRRAKNPSLASDSEVRYASIMLLSVFLYLNARNTRKR